MLLSLDRDSLIGVGTMLRTADPAICNTDPAPAPASGRFKLGRYFFKIRLVAIQIFFGVSFNFLAIKYRQQNQLYSS